MKTSFKDFTIFNNFVNKKLDRNKNERALHVKIFPLEKENECLWNEINRLQSNLYITATFGTTKTWLLWQGGRYTDNKVITSCRAH